MARQILHANHTGIIVEEVGEELQLHVDYEGFPEGSESLPPGGVDGDILRRLGESGVWGAELAAVVDGVIVDAAANGHVSYDLSVARTIRSTVTGNVTSAVFTNLPSAGTWVWIVKMDAVGEHMLSGLHAVDRWLDGRGYPDINRSPNATSILVYTWDGAELTGAVAWNGVLDLDAREMNFHEDGSIIVPITRAETLDLGNVTNLQADGTAGTGALTYQRGRAGELTAASGVTPLEAGDVLVVTLANSTTPSAVSIPRRVT